MGEERLVTEVPSSLKQLARLVVRGFYTIEDAFIVDMLVRNPCMKEDDICELLKFERKMLRARISTLRNDKFIQVRLKMETGVDGKAQKVNYYFINYKTFVNVVKYKLDIMRKRMETEERDATSRASFKCPGCLKTFTDLEADQLFDCLTEEFRCTYCQSVVEEDQSALPKKDSRLLLARFNEQLEPLYMLLREVEGIKLSPEILEPEPVDINTIRGLSKGRPLPMASRDGWSGEATRGGGFAVEESRVDVTIGDETFTEKTRQKETPIWITETTIADAPVTDAPTSLPSVEVKSEKSSDKSKVSDNIMSVLLANEKRTSNTKPVIPGNESDSDSSGDEAGGDVAMAEVGEMEVAESDEEEEQLPVVAVGNRSVPLDEVNDKLIATMTSAEKEAYIQIYQEYYSHLYD